MEDIFKNAVMNGVLFNTPMGYLNVVQVAQLPLLSNKGLSLDGLYIGLEENREILSKSIIPLSKSESDNITIKVEIVKSIIEYKQAELTRLAKAREDAEFKKVLVEALSKKQADNLANMSIEEIQAKLKELA